MFQSISGPDLKTLAVAGCLICALAGPSMAGLSKIFRDSDLEPGDVELASGAAESLYTKKGVVADEKVRWSSATSGAFGVVIVLNVDRAENCVSFRHLIEAASGKRSRLDVRRCQNTNGDWVLSTE
ncbi:MAG: hypothetical protein ACR2O1_03025 [Boseongicola sp.]